MAKITKLEKRGEKVNVHIDGTYRMDLDIKDYNTTAKFKKAVKDKLKEYEDSLTAEQTDEDKVELWETELKDKDL